MSQLTLTCLKFVAILVASRPILELQPDGPTAAQWDDPEEFAEEQTLIGKVIHLLKADSSPDQQYQILSNARSAEMTSF